MKNKLQFRVSSATKSILGKDLIVDRNIAMFELVKNAYDACAKKVDIYISDKKITITDDGDGMDLNDIKNKWLYVGYSEKADNKNAVASRCKRRTFAGAKGIGRLACDRLGKNLILTSIKNNSIEQLNVKWEDFEKNAKVDFDKINIEYTNLKKSPDKNFKKGIKLEVTMLREKWNVKDIEKIKRHLTKLISPVKEDRETFDIYIHYDGKKTKVENFIFDELGLRTTGIDVSVSRDGKFITTELIDRGERIYKIVEKNEWSNKIANIKTQLLYLSRPTKLSFFSLTKERAYNFGSIFLYNNGFRVYPFGEPGDDSLKIDRRKGQGYARYLGTRDLMGYIVITNNTGEFKETSSRDGGLLNTQGYRELKLLFLEKVLKRLETYTIDTLSWTYSLKEEKEFSPTDRKKEIKGLIEKLTKTKNFVRLEYSFSKFAKNIDRKINEGFYGATGVLRKQAEKTKDPILKQAVNKIEEAQKKQEKTIKQQEVAIEKKDKEIESEKKKGAFQGALVGTDKERIVGMQHQILHSSSRINRNIKLLLKHLGAEKLDNQIKKYIKVISLESSKINSIANFVTKANFNLRASKINTNIIDFIEDYINEIYLIKDRVIETHLEILFKNNYKKEYIKEIRPLELTNIIDIFISNSEKAKATKMEFIFSRLKNKLKIEVVDNGNGVSSENLDKIFDMGFTTTNGSGIGLFQARDLIENNLKGEISILLNKIKGVTFLILL